MSDTRVPDGKFITMEELKNAEYEGDPIDPVNYLLRTGMGNLLIPSEILLQMYSRRASLIEFIDYSVLFDFNRGESFLSMRFIGPWGNVFTVSPHYYGVEKLDKIPFVSAIPSMRHGESIEFTKEGIDYEIKAFREKIKI